MWVLVVLGCVLIGTEAGKLLFAGNDKLAAKKRSIQSLSVALREIGMRVIPDALDEFVIADANGLLEKLHDLSTILKAGNETMIKEVQATFDSMLNKKLSTPEGRALIEAKLAEAKKIADLVVPIAVTAAKAAAAAA
jgi:hypothetical protein